MRDNHTSVTQLMNEQYLFFRKATRNRHVLFNVLPSTVSQRVLHCPPPATEGRHILPYHAKPESPCEHNLPTPCPPSTPILVQFTNSGRNQYVQVHQGPADNLLQRLHTDLLNRTAIDTLNSLNKSPAVEAISPIQGSRHDHSFYICQLCYPKLTHIMNIGATLHHMTHEHNTDRHNHRDKLTQ